VDRRRENQKLKMEKRFLKTRYLIQEEVNLRRRTTTLGPTADGKWNLPQTTPLDPNQRRHSHFQKLCISYTSIPCHNLEDHNVK